MSAALDAQHVVDEARRKRLETLRPQLALRGFELRETFSGTFIVKRWGLAREFGGLDPLGEAEGFARTVGAIA